MPINLVEVIVRSRMPLIEVGGGLPGPQGTSITGGTINGSGHLILTLSNGSTIDSGYVVGPPGPISSISETGNGINIDLSTPSAPVLSLDATLEAIANFATGAGVAMYWTGTDTLGSYTTTAFGRGFAGAADPAAGRTALLLGSVAVLTAGTAAGNVPVLDGSGQLPTSVLPALAITETNVVGSQAAMLALTAQRGDVAVRTDLNKSFILATDSPGTLADWKELLTPTDAVLSVAGLTGAISAANLLTAIGLATSNSPQFAGLNIGHATDTTLGRTSPGVINVEGVDVLLTTLQQDVSNKDLTDSNVNIVDATDRTKKLQLSADLVPTGTTNVLTAPPASGVILTDPIAVSSVLPTLDLRLTNFEGAPFDDYFSRTGIGGYRQNAKGILVPTSDREPVIDYSAGTALGTGFYGAYTNLLLRSEEFDNATWTKLNCTVTANSTVAPDGATTMDLLNATAGSGSVGQGVNLSVGSTTVHTFGFFLKQGTAAVTRVQMVFFTGGTTNSVIADITWATLAVVISGSANNKTYQFDDIGGGIYRLSLSGSNSGGANTLISLEMYPAASGTGTVYAWGAQLTATAFPVPYVPTTSAAVARAADGFGVSGVDFTDFYNPREGTVYLEGDIPGEPAAVQNLIHFHDGTNNNLITVRQGAVITGVDLIIYNGGVVQVDTASANIRQGNTFKVGVNFATNSAALYSGGVVVGGIDPSVTMPTVTAMNVNPVTGSGIRLRRLIYWPKALSAAQLERMTA